jgi:hypothetical protein
MTPILYYLLLHVLFHLNRVKVVIELMTIQDDDFFLGKLYPVMMNHDHLEKLIKTISTIVHVTNTK